MAFDLTYYLEAHRKSMKRYNELMSYLGVDETGSEETVSYVPGISVIVPSYKGADRIGQFLQSISEQSLPHDDFEVLIILNGDGKEQTKAVIERFLNIHPTLNVVIYETDVSSASVARNRGITHANRCYVTFVDDDDYISPDYLSAMYEAAEKEAVVISEIHDITEDNQVNKHSIINEEVKDAYGKSTLQFVDVFRILRITTCKLLPMQIVKKYRFDETLTSGEDLLFYCTLFSFEQLTIKLAKKETAIYYRTIRRDSVSRQQLSFDFNVLDRLQVIEKLNQLIIDQKNKSASILPELTISGQASFIRRYLEAYPDDVHKVKTALANRVIHTFPYELLNKGRAKKLVISYCFPPYVDTSANVMAKRIRAEKKIVDVVYNDMSEVRDLDLRINRLVDDLIDERHVIETRPSFSNFSLIYDFVKEGYRQINFQKDYESMYSRAMWPGSHFLAYHIKKKHPKLTWQAEYSDPILYDIYGKERYAKITDKRYLKALSRHIKKTYHFTVKKNDNLFFWAEYLPYFFSDELIFTNDNQLAYMLNRIQIPELVDIVKKKAVVLEHPTMKSLYYNIARVDYEVKKDVVNLAYFGNFYGTRKLDDLFKVLDTLDKTQQKQIKLHIFTSKPKELTLELSATMTNSHLVQVNGYLDYLSFLSVTKKFDCLIVNDATTKGELERNPFLPSKLSDYQGSGSKIWGIYEEGSILSQKELDYRSPLGDKEAIKAVYETLISNKFNVD